MILDVNYGSKEKIKAVEGDNLERIETIYLKANGEIVNLTGLTCDMAYMDITNIGVGNVIENLTISNPTGGEVQLPINNEITKRNGYYNCELRLKNSEGLIKHTAYFELEISKNIFNQIAKPILNSEGFKKIQQILSSIDTYNKDLEDKLNTLSSLDSSNIEAKENIKNLQDNSNKAAELNKELTANVSSVDSKNNMLKDSLKKAEDFSKTLVGGTDFVQMRKDIDTLENGLKNNQSLAYSGSDITCNNSLAGRTSGLKLYGKTLYKRKDGTYTDTWEEGCTLESCGEAEGNKISILSTGKNLINPKKCRTGFFYESDIRDDNEIFPCCECMLKKGETYTLSDMMYGCYLDKNRKFLANINVDFKKQFTSQFTGIAIFRPNSSYSEADTKYKNLKDFINKFIMVEGNSIGEYEPYQEYKKEIQLQQPFAGLENIQDTIEETEKGVVLTQNIGKIVLNGTEDWAINNSVENTKTISFWISDYVPKDLINCNSSLISQKSFVSNIKILPKYTFNTELICFHNYMGIKWTYISVSKSKLQTQDVSGLKKYLQANPITVYYQLAEPKAYVLKGIEETDIDTYNSITYIKSLNTIPAAIDFSISTNYGSLLMQHSQEINKIWDTIYNIVYPILTENAVEISKAQAKNLLN